MLLSRAHQPHRVSSFSSHPNGLKRACDPSFLFKRTLPSNTGSTWLVTTRGYENLHICCETKNAASAPAPLHFTYMRKRSRRLEWHKMSFKTWYQTRSCGHRYWHICSYHTMLGQNIDLPHRFHLYLQRTHRTAAIQTSIQPSTWSASFVALEGTCEPSSRHCLGRHQHVQDRCSVSLAVALILVERR